jgi:hypothetical protein
MTPQQLFSKIRMAPEINDNAQVKYSDYQLTDALNTVLSIVFNTLSQSSNELLTADKKLTLTDGVCALPDDFLSVVNVFAGNNVLKQQSKSMDVDSYTYRIRGNNIYSSNDVLTLDYKPYFIEIDDKTLTAELPLPNYFSELLKKYAVMSLQGGINKADTTIVQQITNDVYKLTSGREYSSMELQASFRV